MKTTGRLSRRKFLKDSALAGAAVTALGRFNPAKIWGAAGTSIPRSVLLAGFQRLSDDYGPIDCWWWEAGRLTEEKMRWQLNELKEKGVSGTWLYPRFVYGEPLESDPPYWSDDWWKLVEFTMSTQKTLGLKSWISDWTSHEYFQVLLRKEAETNPELVGHRLVIHQRESKPGETLEVEIPAEEQILHAAAYKKSGDGLDYASQRDLNDTIKNRRIEWRAPEGGWLVTVITSQQYDLDYLNRVVVDKWLEALLGEYEKRVPESVGNTLAAYGPDEMKLLVGNALYSRSLIDAVQSERGYDITPHLVALFYDVGPKTDQIRCDYYGTMASLLEDNFYKPIARWLRDHGMKYVTIATWGREDLLGQTYHYGDYFRYMRCFDITGDEDPGQETIPERHLIDTKISSSVAHLYTTKGHPKQVAACCYWGSGWGMTQEENIAWTNGNYACGVTVFNQHGGLYSLLAGWYEWVPPDIDYFQPYWDYYKYFTNYIKRLSSVMSQGTHCADVALLYPITTIHANWTVGKVSGPYGDSTIQPAFTSQARESSEAFMNLLTQIYKDAIDLDVVDYHSLENSAVESGTLKVSDLSFRVLVLPPMTTIRMSTLQKVREFYAGGGIIIAFGRLPSASAERGRQDPEIRSIIEDIFGVSPEESAPLSTEQINSSGGRAYFVSADEADERRVPELIREVFTPDIVCNEDNLFFTHQRIGENDVYFLVNTEGDRRKLKISFKAVGGLEAWDPVTGKISKVYRVERQGDRTEACLDMEPYEGSILVFAPSPSSIEVLDDNVSQICAVDAVPEGLRIRGLDARGGNKKISVRHNGARLLAEGTIDSPPSPIKLSNPFVCQLEPTMDNRWGDFRYPPSQQCIGAEARSFRYMEEETEPGTSLGWQEPQFDDSAWPAVRYSYGPYWWHIGPFAEGEVPSALEEAAKNGLSALDQSYKSSGGSLRWKPYSFSQEFGNFGGVQRTWGGILGVSENFFVLPNNGLPEATHYLYTFVNSPREGDFTLYFGDSPEKAGYINHVVPTGDAIPERGQYEVPNERQAWVNGALVVDLREKRTDAVSAKVHLEEGWNPVLLKLVQRVARPETPKADNRSESLTGSIATYAVIRESEPPARDPYIPRIRWFADGKNLTYDILPNKEKRVAWYRFSAPPGLESIQFNIRAHGVKAWVNGEPVAVGNSQIKLASVLKRPSQVALCVDQESGVYGGATFPEPVTFSCKEGEIALGDWSSQGLETYSGAILYRKAFTLRQEHLRGNAILDLGWVKTCAEVHVNRNFAGVRLARPFQFDVTDLIKEGENEIRVRVVNTLANHMSSYPTNYVYEPHQIGEVYNSARSHGSYPGIYSGQAVSGLFGPVELRFLSPVSSIATASVSDK